MNELFAEAYYAEKQREQENEASSLGANKTDPMWCYENYEASAECIDQQAQEIVELQSHINDLREALEDIATDSGGCCDSGYSAAFVAKSILSKTPAQSLIEHDNEVIERCAKVVDESYAFDSDGFAKAIRALKGK